MNKICFMLLALVFASCASTEPEKRAAEGTYDGELNILMLADAGRNGSYDQRLNAEWMGVYADALGPEFVISCGDLFHYQGIQSTEDPLLWSNFESIYTHGELQCPWYGVLGNHEYRGNTQAMMDYSEVSRRWNMPDRYYTLSVPLDDDEPDSERVRFLFIDTTPLIDKYREDPAQYPDVQEVDPDAEVRWIDSVLRVSPEQWKIVVGHHPLYSYDKKDDIEQENLRARLEEEAAGSAARTADAVCEREFGLRIAVVRRGRDALHAGEQPRRAGIRDRTPQVTLRPEEVPRRPACNGRGVCSEPESKTDPDIAGSVFR